MTVHNSVYCLQANAEFVHAAPLLQILAEELKSETTHTKNTLIVCDKFSSFSTPSITLYDTEDPSTQPRE